MPDEKTTMDDSNPRNWSLQRKWLNVAIVSLFSFICTLASSTISPALQMFEAEFHVGQEVAVLIFCIFNLGLTIGTVISPPTSEKIGRRPVFLVAMPLMLIFVMACGFSHDLGNLLTWRLVAGLFASPGITIASASMTDLFESEDRGPGMFTYYSMPWLGSVLGPLIGHLVLSEKDWPWTQWVFLFIAIPIVLPGLFLLRETRQDVIEEKEEQSSKSLRERIDLSKVGSALMHGFRSTPEFLTTHIARPVRMLFTEPIVGLVCLYSGFNFGLIYAFIVVVPEIFHKTYGFAYTGEGLVFLGLIVGALAGFASLIVDEKFIPKTKRMGPTSTLDTAEEDVGKSESEPENRLHGAMLGGILLPIGLYWFAWTARNSVSFYSPVFATILVSWGSLNVYASTSAYVLDTYGPTYGASANGASSLARYGMSFVAPLFALPMYHGLGTGWATTLLGICATLMAPIPFCFYRWGPRIRQRCKFTTEA